MKVRAYLDNFDISGAVLVESLSITQDSTEAVSTAQISFIQKYGEARYDQAEYSHASYRYTWNAQEWAQVVISDQDTGQLLFAGFVLAVQRAREGPHVRFNMSASDWGILFERTVMTQVWPPNTLDSTIIQDCLAMVPELSAGTIVTQIGDLGEISAKDQRVRDVLDLVCSLTGSEWNVSYDGKLNYYRTGSIMAPFGLSDRPNGSTTMPYELEDYNSDFTGAANRVLVLGALDEISEVRETAEDKASQLQYGLLALTIVARDVVDPATAQLLAQSEVAQRAWPQISGRVSLIVPGLSRGMTVNVEAIKYGFAGALLLRSMTITIAAPDRARPDGHILRYQASLGPRPPDLVYTLRRMQREAPDSTFAANATVPEGSITIDHFADGIEPVQIVNALPALPDPAYSDTAVILWTQAPGGPQIYRRTGNTWTAFLNASDIEGQLQTNQFAPGSITSTILADGSMVTAKIPAGAIQAPQLAASSVTANAIAANAIYAEALQANSVTSQAIVANAVTAGKIAALAVVAGNIAANAITVGTIAAGAIRAQDAVFQTGAIQSADIASLMGNKITANTITSDKLSVFELAVGAGGDKPGKINVYDGSRNIVAVIGDLSSTGAGFGAFGVWGKLVAAGGNGFFDAPMKTDTAGNLFLNNATFQISAGGATIKTSPTTFDQSYAALALTNTQGADMASFVSRGLVLYNNGQVIGAFVRHPTQSNASQLALSSPGSLALVIDGFTASIRADGGYGIAGEAGRTETFTVGGVQLRFRGGLYVGH